VPADDKENARLIISQVILDVLKDLKMAYPTAGGIEIHPQGACQVMPASSYLNPASAATKRRC
jgi:hypothetical protein